MKITSIICIATLMILFSCQDRINTLLPSEEGKLWNFSYYKKKIKGVFRFYNNGDCFYYIYNKDRSISRYRNPHVILINKWYSKGKDTVNIIGKDAIVLRSSPDSILLIHIDSKDTLLFTQIKQGKRIIERE